MTDRTSAKYPKVGIRPVIDARQGGVRESLENQTMNMAKSAAALISSRLRYPDGFLLKFRVNGNDAQTT